MATESYAYDHPAYQARIVGGGQTIAGNAAQSNRFAAFTALLAKSAQVTVAVAGTGTGNNSITVNKVTATTTTSLASVVLGTSAIGVTTNLTLGNTALAQGDVLACLNGADVVGVAAVTYECLITPGATVTD